VCSGNYNSVASSVYAVLDITGMAETAGGIRIQALSTGRVSRGRESRFDLD